MQDMPASIDFARLYDDHAQALFAFLLNLTRNEADTRDLLQEVFVKIWTKADRFAVSDLSPISISARCTTASLHWQYGVSRFGCAPRRPLLSLKGRYLFEIGRAHV